jgi:hypothetical protein
LSRAPLRHTGFRYAFLPRLIDDSDLLLLGINARKAARRKHLKIFWKSLVLLRRDAKRVLSDRRAAMQAHEDWSFSSLTTGYVYTCYLIWTLAAAGCLHALHIPSAINLARKSCRAMEFAMAGAVRSHALSVSTLAEIQ